MNPGEIFKSSLIRTLPIEISENQTENYEHGGNQPERSKCCANRLLAEETENKNGQGADNDEPPKLPISMNFFVLTSA